MPVHHLALAMFLPHSSADAPALNTPQAAHVLNDQNRSFVHCWL
jgi:hypothetical protein